MRGALQRCAAVVTDPLVLHFLACSLFAFLGITYQRLFFVFNVLDYGRVVPALKVRWLRETL